MVMSLLFDGAFMLKIWGGSWLLLPGINNWKAAEVTDHFWSTFFDRADAGDESCP